MKTKIGLVLSGGYANGAYEHGILKYIEDNGNNLEIEYIIATSIGALNATAFLSNKLGIAGEHWADLDFTGFKSFYRKIIRGRYYETVIQDILDTKMISQSTTKLYITATSYPSLELKYFKLNSKGDEYIRNVIQAAISVPKLMKEVTINGKRYMDGGIRDNIPIGLLRSMKTDTPAYVIHFDPMSIKSRIKHELVGNRIHEIQFVDEKSRHLNGIFDFSGENISKLYKQGYYDASKVFGKHKNRNPDIRRDTEFRFKYLRNAFFIVGRMNTVMEKLKREWR
ncbi:MAG TPA: patatin-like phospholipase family protein [Clostridia bacterium]|nr:patatin-like phospholipase family protein [Clostridia bacterium]